MGLSMGLACPLQGDAGWSRTRWVLRAGLRRARSSAWSGTSPSASPAQTTHAAQRRDAGQTARTQPAGAHLSFRRPLLLVVLLGPCLAEEVVVRSTEPSSSGLPVSVVESGSHRVLLLGRVVIGAEYLDWARDQAAFSGMALMQTLAFLSPAPSRILALGLGSGTAPAFFRARGIETDVLELEPAVIAAAQRHFLFGQHPAPGRTIAADALVWLQTPSNLPADGPYDAVLSDLFDGDNPAGSLSLEHVSLLKRTWLSPNGVLAVNVVAFRSGPNARLARAAAASLGAAFRHVVAFVDHDPTGNAHAAHAHAQPLPSNLLLFASDAPVAFDPPEDGGYPPGSCYHLHSHFRQWEAIELAAASSAVGVLSSGEELREDVAAIRAALPEMQRASLPEAGWAVVDRLVLAAAVEVGDEREHKRKLEL